MTLLLHQIDRKTLRTTSIHFLLFSDIPHCSELHSVTSFFEQALTEAATFGAFTARNF